LGWCWGREGQRRIAIQFVFSIKVIHPLLPSMERRGWERFEVKGGRWSGILSSTGIQMKPVDIQ
jgi:hypothetical protein